MKLFGKRSGVSEMKKKLLFVQAQLSQEGLGQDMRIYQHGFVEKTKTFVAYSENYEAEGLTVNGGLAKFCHNAVLKTIESIESGLHPMPIIVDLAEKMTYVAMSIERLTPESELNEKDRVMIEKAVHIAQVWLAHDQREVFLNWLEAKLNILNEQVPINTPVMAIKNGQKYVQSLMSW